MSRGISVLGETCCCCVNNRVVVDKGVVLVPTADKLMTWSCTASRGVAAFQEEYLSPRFSTDPQAEGTTQVQVKTYIRTFVQW